MRAVLLRLRKANLRLKPKKCRLAREQVEYLGYVVSREGIIADPKKVTAVKEFPILVDLKALRSFLGLASYYRRFIPCFSSVAHPMYALTKKNAPFLWSSSCGEAFNRLKQLLTDAPILSYPDFGKEFHLETDASGVGLGAEARRWIVAADRICQPDTAISRAELWNHGAGGSGSRVGSLSLPTLSLWAPLYCLHGP